jgi:hypothetical protein
MLLSLLIGVFGVAFLMVAWFFVQTKWKKAFADQMLDDDVLANRMSCGNCGCTTICQNNQDDEK